MNPANNYDTPQVTSAYPKFYKRLLSFFSYIYVIAAFGLSGVSNISRLALYSSIIMIFLLVPILGKLKIPKWIFLILFFYSYLALPSFVRDSTNFNQLGTMISVLFGIISISLSLHNKIITHKIIAYGALIAAGINIVAVLMGIDVAVIVATGRSSGLTGNSNSLAISMAFAAFMVWLIPEQFNYTIKLYAVYIAFYSVYVSASKKGLVMLVLFTFLIFINYIAKLKLHQLILLVLTITVSLIISLNSIVQLTQHYGKDLQIVYRVNKLLDGDDNSFNERKLLAKKGYELWKESILFGHGFSQFANLSEFNAYAHNNYIELAVSGGIIGLIIFYSLHLIIFQKAFKKTIILRSRLIIFIFAILLIDLGYVSFYSKINLCTLVFLLTFTSDSDKYIHNYEKDFNNESL